MSSNQYVAACNNTFHQIDKIEKSVQTLEDSFKASKTIFLFLNNDVGDKS